MNDDKHVSRSENFGKITQNGRKRQNKEYITRQKLLMQVSD